MTWTKETPTVPGLYWFMLRVTDKPEGALRHCEVWEGVRKGVLVTSTDGVRPVEGLRRWWFGPFMEPST